jgi:hypothetical protein
MMEEKAYFVFVLFLMPRQKDAFPQVRGLDHSMQALRGRAEMERT